MYRLSLKEASICLSTKFASQNPEVVCLIGSKNYDPHSADCRRYKLTWVSGSGKNSCRTFKTGSDLVKFAKFVIDAEYHCITFSSLGSALANYGKGVDLVKGQVKAYVSK